MSGHLGADLSAFDPSQPIAEHEFNGVLGFLKSFTAHAPEAELTFGDLARRQMSGQWIVGSAEQIADKLAAYGASGVDGFNLVYATTPGTFVDFIEGVAPILKQRRLMHTEYGPGPLRQKIFGYPTLPSRHPGATFRRI